MTKDESSEIDGNSGQGCELCHDLLGGAYAYQKYGHEEDSSSMPAAADKLTLVSDDFSKYQESIKSCPTCSQFFHYSETHEYLTCGSEDEQMLKPISDMKAHELMGSSGNLKERLLAKKQKPNKDQI